MGKKGKPLLTARYMTEVRKGHPVAHADGRVRVHRAVLYEKIGPGWHPCHWCGRPVIWTDGVDGDALIADHVDENTWNNEPDNLVPACNACNLHRHLTLSPTCGNGHPWTVANTYERPDGEGRRCRTCQQIRDAARVRTRRRRRHFRMR